MTYQVGIDIGGTFTDCVVIGDGREAHGKSLTTPGNLSDGFFSAIDVAAGELGSDMQTVLAHTDFILHGTTVGTNAIIERRGAKTGLLTTLGAGDALIMMRGHGRTAGLGIDRVGRVSKTYLPEPLIPRRLTEEIPERVDLTGDVVVPLDESALLHAVERLVSRGVQAIAICFLWSFVEARHERRVQEIIRDRWPDLYVTCSADLIPKWGEYERMAAVAVNSYVGPVFAAYLEDLQQRLDDLNYDGTLLIVQASGGVMTPEAAASAALLTIDSGPAAGVTSSVFLAETQDHPNVICTDMGGTSFDVGLIVDKRPARTSSTILGQYEYLVPKIDIRSIGAGGGSYIWFDDVSQSLKVGPQSAGADPGPVCYGRGGQQPTVTDANLVLGYINPESFAGGRMRLDREAAENALRQLGERLGMSAVEVAAGAKRIIDFQMADLIHQMTIQQGRDPRDFVLLAYGGAGPLHAGQYATELGCSTLIIPRAGVASVWSAFGAARSNATSIVERTDLQKEPFDTERINGTFSKLIDQANKIFFEQGIVEEYRRLELSVDMRYRGQVYEVTMPFERYPCSPRDIDILASAFSRRYEELYGEGAGFAGTGTELVNFRVEAVGHIPKADVARLEDAGPEPPPAAAGPPRQVYLPEGGDWADVPIFLGTELRAGNVIMGPAVVDLPDTTIVLHSGQVASVDELNNIVIDLKGGRN